LDSLNFALNRQESPQYTSIASLTYSSFITFQVLRGNEQGFGGGKHHLQVLSHIQAVDEVVRACDADCVDCMSVRESIHLHFVKYHMEGVQDAILRSNDLTLIQTVPVDHFAMESILRVYDDFVFATWVEPPWVQLPKLVQTSLVQLEDN